MESIRKIPTSGLSRSPTPPAWPSSSANSNSLSHRLIYFHFYSVNNKCYILLGLCFICFPKALYSFVLYFWWNLHLLSLRIHFVARFEVRWQVHITMENTTILCWYTIRWLFSHTISFSVIVCTRVHDPSETSCLQVTHIARKRRRRKFRIQKTP